MSSTQRVDEILRLIDEVLDERDDCDAVTTIEPVAA
jgi:hypothetical protein